MKNIHPWQHPQWQQFQLARRTSHLPHALLFAGINGIGKKHFAEIFAKSLLCKTPQNNGIFCNNCQSCHLYNAKSHPDFLLIEPEETGQMIKIDVIRSLVEWVGETAMLSGYRIVILNPATAMNHFAVNALLKTVEEPPPNTFFILITDQPSRLIATIRSRCQKVFFKKPNRETALQFLKENHIDATRMDLLLNLAEGAPLKALMMADDQTIEIREILLNGLTNPKYSPLKLAAELQEFALLDIFNLLQMGLKDLLTLKLSRDHDIINADFKEKFAAVAQVISSIELVHFIDFVKYTYQKISGPYNLNKLLVLEEVFIHWNKTINTR